MLGSVFLAFAFSDNIFKEGRLHHPVTPVQESVMAKLEMTAKMASAAATQSVLDAFDDPMFRGLLKKALSPTEVTTLDPTVPASDMLRRFRAEVAVAEAVHSFDSAWLSGADLTLAERLNTSYLQNLWQYQVTAGKASAAVADRAGFGAMHSAEVGVFGFPPFTGRRDGDPNWPAGVWQANMSEAQDRPIYTILNLRKIVGFIMTPTSNSHNTKPAVWF